MQIVYSPKFLEHDTRQHPECSERLTTIINFLEKKGFSQRNFKEPLQVNNDDLLCVHSKELIEQVKENSKQEIGVTGDNVFNKNTFSIAKLACGAALKAAKLASKEFSFALVRPPGHHASYNTFGGFCYFNNLAFAVKQLQLLQKFDKCLIADFDVHHGQGTQNIFCKQEEVFYLSFHQNPLTIYPFRIFNEGCKNNKNVSLNAGTSDNEYLQIFEKQFTSINDSFKPDLIAVSAGFDSFHKDTATGNQLEIKNSETFFQIGKIIKQNSSAKIFSVLEGGYYLPMLGENVFNFLKAFL